MATLEDYLKLITSEYNNQPKMMAWFGVVLQGLVDAQNLALSLPTLFDLDTAVGEQLDMVGKWVGLTRYIDEPLQPQVFSFDVPGLGWDQAVWAEAFPAPNAAIVRLDDEHYRMVLKVGVLRNTWDGTREGAYTAWRTLFGSEGFQILIQESIPKRVPYFSFDKPGLGWDQGIWYDPGFTPNAANDMTILYALVGPPIDALTLALFVGGYFDFMPAGTHVDYATQSEQGVPMFAWDAPEDSLNLAGWDKGAWATITPGQ